MCPRRWLSVSTNAWAASRIPVARCWHVAVGASHRERREIVPFIFCSVHSRRLKKIEHARPILRSALLHEPTTAKRCPGQQEADGEAAFSFSPLRGCVAPTTARRAPCPRRGVG
ncbi:hypothetical protein SETIT_2G340300v2 [Setaria italica]|uniref:Uncharacterized protein n=1 Tax=Setaria italica TaxID=4555 RepID=A0A368Q5S5_SETIT|nr:hypothetical protein SETIT_2G340300v2 [Setaria italica]